MKKVMAIFGTRPEAIKMAPVVSELKLSQSVKTIVCVTAQHRQMLDKVLALFEIEPDYDLDIMQPDQTLDQITGSILGGVGRVLDDEKPDVVLVHGDTTTTLAASLAAFYRRIKIGHVEAGLRTGSLLAPWPEELNRRVASLMAHYHFAPTEVARQNLLNEGIDHNIVFLTGNTVIDALLRSADRLVASSDRVAEYEKQFSFLDNECRLVLVTGHRRENIGEGLENICRALLRIADIEQVQLVFPLHPNPNVRDPVERLLRGHPNIFLMGPQDYEPFIYLMQKSFFIITDSGGVQEEAPSLGKPVLVTRSNTERPEAVEAGTVILVGTNEHTIVEQAKILLSDDTRYKDMSHAANPYGDGQAAARIRAILEK